MPESILLISTVGGDDQGEYSDVSHCAVYLTRSGFETLRARMLTFDAIKPQLDIFKVMLNLPNGVSVSFFNEDTLDSLPEMSPELREILDRGELGDSDGSHYVLADAEADLLNDACAEAERELDWRVDGEFISIYDRHYFYTKGLYKHATGAVESEEIRMEQLEAAFSGIGQLKESA